MNKVFVVLYLSHSTINNGLWIEVEAFANESHALNYLAKRISVNGKISPDWKEVNPRRWVNEKGDSQIIIFAKEVV